MSPPRRRPPPGPGTSRTRPRPAAAPHPRDRDHRHAVPLHRVAEDPLHRHRVPRLRQDLPHVHNPLLRLAPGDLGGSHGAAGRGDGPRRGQNRGHRRRHRNPRIVGPSVGRRQGGGEAGRLGRAGFLEARSWPTTASHAKRGTSSAAHDSVEEVPTGCRTAAFRTWVAYSRLANAARGGHIREVLPTNGRSRERNLRACLFDSAGAPNSYRCLISSPVTKAEPFWLPSGMG